MMFGFEIFNRNPLTIYKTGFVAVTVTPEHFVGDVDVMKHYEGAS